MHNPLLSVHRLSAMFLLVNNFKMIEMLLNVVHGQVQKSEQKPITKGFPIILRKLTMFTDIGHRDGTVGRESLVN